MICPTCKSSLFFLEKNKRNTMRCFRCGFKGKYIEPNYDGYHDERYSYKFIRNEANDPLVNKIVSSMNFVKDDYVLDYGCGAGDMTNTISNYSDHVTGVDINITGAVSKFRKLNFKKQTGIKIDFLDNYFDKIVAVNVIEHVRDYNYLLNEFKRVLKPKGMIFITSYDKNFVLHKILNDPTHVIEWDLNEFEEIFKKDFIILKSFKYGSFFNYRPLNKIIVKILKPEICILAVKS